MSSSEFAQSLNPRVEDPHYLSSTRHFINGLRLQQVKFIFNTSNDLKMDFPFRFTIFKQLACENPTQSVRCIKG